MTKPSLQTNGFGLLDPRLVAWRLPRLSKRIPVSPGRHEPLTAAMPHGSRRMVEFPADALEVE